MLETQCLLAGQERPWGAARRAGGGGWGESSLGSLAKSTGPMTQTDPEKRLATTSTACQFNDRLRDCHFNVETESFIECVQYTQLHLNDEPRNALQSNCMTIN